MSTFRYRLLWLMWHLFGLQSVLLIDFDGEIDARLVGGPPKYRYATRFGWCGVKVLLSPGGETKGVSFVRRWEPLFPPADETALSVSRPDRGSPEC